VSTISVAQWQSNVLRNGQSFPLTIAATFSKAQSRPLCFEPIDTVDIAGSQSRAVAESGNANRCRKKKNNIIGSH
jgi:hypothetical protein